MRLNSTPSAANSSWPSVGTRVEKSPRPSRWAASRKLLDAPLQRLRRDDGEREREDEEADEDREARRRVRDALVARRTVGPRTATRARAPWKSGRLRAREPVAPAHLAWPSRGRSAGVRRRASTRPRGRCAGRRPGRPSGAGSARRRRRPSWPATSSRPTSRPAASSSSRVAGRIAAGSPTSLTVARSRVSRMRAAPSARRRASRRARSAARSPSRTAVATWRSCATRVASRSPWATASCIRPAVVRCCAASCVLALPVSLVPISAKTMKPTATMGTRTISRKKSVSRPRKLIRRLNVALRAARRPRAGRTAGYAVRTFAGL